MSFMPINQNITFNTIGTSTSRDLLVRRIEIGFSYCGTLRSGGSAHEDYKLVLPTKCCFNSFDMLKCKTSTYKGCQL